MKVGDSVLCFKTSKHASIINGVGCAGHGCFELDIRLLIRTHSNIMVF